MNIFVHIAKQGVRQGDIMTEEAQRYLQRLNEKISQLQARKQTLVSRNKEKQRKARTRRLIQNGALAEKYLHCENMQPQEFEKFLQKFCDIGGKGI